MRSGSERNTPITVWCLLRDQFAHVQPVESYLGDGARFVYDGAWCSDSMLRAAPDVVVLVNEHYTEATQCLVAAQAANIPTVCVQDGILEWRCQYENPLFGEGGGSPQHQPVLADKIACIGRQSARQIERWGNAGKCEVVGMPRLDYLLSRQWPGSPPTGKKRLLVMTAKKAGFTPSQVDVTLRSLRDVQSYLATRRGFEVRWRVSRQCASRLDIPNLMDQSDSRELTSVLESVDAVVTTPSTAMLESMLMGKPVAVLDYHNVPRFVPSAWTITAQSHIQAVIEEIVDPPARKVAYQNDYLHDALECTSPASPRVGELLYSVAQAGRQARDAGLRLLLPACMVAAVQSPLSPMPSLTDLYPGQSIFLENDLTKLQVRLARAENENARLQKRLRSQSLAVRAAAALKTSLWK